MEQIQQLFDILKETPEMALWGISIYFLFVLLKLSSWILVIKIVLMELIKRYFDNEENKRQIQSENLTNSSDLEALRSNNDTKIAELNSKHELFEIIDNSVFANKYLVSKMFLAIGDGKRLHSSDIEAVTKLILDSKDKLKD